jgi:hypothetical protein
MTVNAVIALFVFFVCIAALAVLWAGGIADEPPPTEAAERRYVLSGAQYADVMARRESKEAWTRIAASYNVAATTLMNAMARYRAAQRKEQKP